MSSEQLTGKETGYQNPYKQIAKTIKGILQEESQKSEYKKEKKEQKAISKQENSVQSEQTLKAQPKQTKFDVMLESIRCTKRKNPKLILWPLFYRALLRLDSNISEYNISSAFCLIDEESKGQITMTQLKAWVSSKDEVTDQKVKNNQVLRCIDIIKEHQYDFCQNNMSYEEFKNNFRKIKIDEMMIKDEFIRATFNHLKCNVNSNNLNQWERFLGEKYEQKQRIIN